MSEEEIVDGIFRQLQCTLQRELDGIDPALGKWFVNLPYEIEYYKWEVTIGGYSILSWKNVEHLLEQSS